MSPAQPASAEPTNPSGTGPTAPVKKTGLWKKAGIRGVAAGICMVLAAVIMPLGVIAFWGQRTLTDTQRFVETFEPLSTDPTVQEAIATTVADSITAAVDIPKVVATWLPPEAAPLAGPMSSVVDSFIHEAVAKFLATPQFHKLWITINTELQKAVIAALSGDQSGAVSIQGDNVVLDLGEVAKAVQAELVSKGLTAIADKPIPQTANQQIVLLNSKQLGQARTIYKFTVPAARWLIVAVFLLFAAAIGISRRRARMTVAVGLGIVIACGIFRIGLAVAEGPAANSFAGTPFAASGAIFYTTLTNYLRQAFDWMILLGILIAIVGWLCSSNDAAIQVRSWAKGAADSIGSKNDQTVPPPPPAS